MSKQSNTWRLQHKDKRNEWRKRNYNKTTNAINSNKHWSQKEEKLVLMSELTDFELAQIIGRSVQAIQLRRHKLTKIIKNKESLKGDVK